MSADDALGPALEATQQTLAAEHAAVYAYGVLGGRVDPLSAEAVRARAGYDAHGDRRDRLERMLYEAEIEPVAAEPGYALPARITDPARAARLAVRVEDRCAEAYAELVACSTGRLRADAAGWLGDAAVRGLTWGAEPAAFPGLRRP